MRRSKPEETLDEPACERRALDLLTRREHSRFELERKLGTRGFPGGVIAATLDRLEESGLLAAARFGASLIRTRVAKGRGPVRIRAELIDRGIDGERADELIAAEGIDWAAAARDVRRKRFGGTSPRELKERARQARFLEYRGFDSGQIRAALELERESD